MTHPAFDQRFTSRLTAQGDCVVWTGARSAAGYGQLRRSYVLLYAHRVSYEQHHGPIPQGMEVLHSCDTPACVNPDHLVLGTHAENMADMARKGRTGNRKLTDAQVREIRRAWNGRFQDGETRRLAKKYGVSRATIQAAAYGRLHQQVK